MCNILVVDDNDFERQSLVKILKKYYKNITILDTDSGHEALKLMSQQLINILITDMKMPIMDGVELINRVRELDKKIKIIIISGYDDFSYAKKVLALNVENYILKPVNPMEIKETMNQILITKDDETKFSAPVKEVIRIIELEYGTNITLEVIAERINLSTPYLGALFSKELGTTFNQYLTNIRMKKASELLIDTSFKITTIATLVGINNPSYFNKIFKQKFDVTPVEYRNSRLDK